ncbi:unnamed protein product [Boreogadus saida]
MERPAALRGSQHPEVLYQGLGRVKPLIPEAFCLATAVRVLLGVRPAVLWGSSRVPLGFFWGSWDFSSPIRSSAVQRIPKHAEQSSQVQLYTDRLCVTEACFLYSQETSLILETHFL